MIEFTDSRVENAETQLDSVQKEAFKLLLPLLLFSFFCLTSLLFVFSRLTPT